MDSATACMYTYKMTTLYQNKINCRKYMTFYAQTIETLNAFEPIQFPRSKKSSAELFPLFEQSSYISQFFIKMSVH